MKSLKKVALIQIGFLLFFSMISVHGWSYGLKREIDKMEKSKFHYLGHRDYFLAKTTYAEDAADIKETFNLIRSMADKAVEILVGKNINPNSIQAQHAWNYLLKRYKEKYKGDYKENLKRFLLNFNTKVIVDRSYTEQEKFKSYLALHRKDKLKEEAYQPEPKNSNHGNCCTDFDESQDNTTNK